MRPFGGQSGRVNVLYAVAVVAVIVIVCREIVIDFYSAHPTYTYIRT